MIKKGAILVFSFESEWVQFIANLDDIRGKTIEPHGEELFNLCECFFTECQQQVTVFEEYLQKHDLDRRNSIFYLRLIQYHWDDLHIITMYILSGLYSQTFRELRFLLESFTQGYFLDNDQPFASLQDKMATLGQEHLYGYKLFERAFAGQKKTISQFASTYKKLSRYVHGSPQELKKFDNPNYRRVLSGAIVHYREDDFKRCLTLWKQVHRLIMGLIQDNED